MKTHTLDGFEGFMSQLKETNNTLSFFCDFDKIRRNVGEVMIDLNTLNYLVGKQDVDAAITDLWNHDSRVFEVLPILIAVRDGNKKVIDGDCVVRKLGYFLNSLEGVKRFVRETGLGEVFCNGDVKNLVDYVFGVEAGLDSNARKNRGGDIMQNTVGRIFSRNSIPFRAEVYASDLHGLEVLGVDEKRFDFVITTSRKVYLIEVNFYNSGGSKLNEVARSYTELSPKINDTGDYEFVWITDGRGWNSARNKLGEAYRNIPHVYNLTSISEFVNLVRGEL